MNQKTKLQMLNNNIETLNNAIPTLTVSSYRMTGSKLQSRRLRMWKQNSYCNCCQLFVVYPDGFELDHIVPLHKYGEDKEENCQILCHECHDKKTKEDLTSI